MNDIARVISRLEQQRSTIDRAISALRELEPPKPAEAAPDGASAAKPKKRRMSAEGRRRIAEAARRRWAEKRATEAAQANQASATKKTSAAKNVARQRLGGKRTTAPAAA